MCNIWVTSARKNKPIPVLAESLKFVQFFPLGQEDFPAEYKYPASILFTDLGTLRPHTLRPISDELKEHIQETLQGQWQDSSIVCK